MSHHINQGTKASTESSATVTVTGNKGKSAASFCHHVASWVSDMFCNFYFVKYHKIANNSATTEAREKISTYLESLEFLDGCLTKFKKKNYETLFNKNSHRFLVTT